MRFVPAADRAKQREKAIREAEMDQVAAAAGERAVLAELRAIEVCRSQPALASSGQYRHKRCGAWLND